VFTMRQLRRGLGRLLRAHLRGRVTAVAATAAIVVAACGGGATPSPSPAASASPSAAPSPSASPSAAPSAAASPSAVACAAGDLNCLLFQTNYKPGPGQSGGTLVLGEWQAPDQLNPFYTTAFTSIEALQPALRGLLTITSDGKYIPDLAESVPTLDNGGVVIAPDGKSFTITVKLKPGLQWSDGQPLTMNDLKFTWQWATDKSQTGCTGCAVGYPLIDKIDVSSDGLTATIHFKQLWAGWLGWLTAPILPQHYMSKISIADAPKKSMPVSSDIKNVPWSGPFMIVNASSTEIDYDRNPYWHGGVSGPHPAYLDHLKFQYFGDKNGEIAAFKNGEIDVALDLLQDSYPAISTVSPSVGTAELTPVWEYEHFDLNNDPSHKRGNGLWDPNVRKAIAMAIDKQAIINAIFPGTQVQPACSPAPPGLWYRKDETCPPYDPNGAKQLLAQAGWTPDANGIVAKNGHEMKLELCTTSGNPTRLTELQKLQGFLKAVGIDSYIKTADAGSVVFAGWNDTKPDTDCSIYRGNYDIADFAYVITGSPYNDYYYTYSSSQWPEKGDHSGSNDTRFADPTMDQALSKLETDVDLKAQLQDAGAVQDAYVAGIPEVPLYYRSEAVGLSVHVGNWPGYAPSSVGPTWDVEDWYYKP
jgi:peptide/nickel transport system substrate-binding protein